MSFNSISLIDYNKANGEDFNHASFLQVTKRFISLRWSQLFTRMIIHPLTFTRTLWQIGYEPYPSVSSKSFWVFGRSNYYFPNTIKYLRGELNRVGLGGIYTGVGASFMSDAFGGFSFFALRFLIPSDIGGPDEIFMNLNDKKDEYKILRFHVRCAIRETICATLSTFVSRPFTTLMIRQIFETVDGPRYFDDCPITALFKLGCQEGPPGLFSGLLPQVISQCVFIWCASTFTYVCDSIYFRYISNENEQDENLKKANEDVHSYMKTALTFIATTIAHPFNVASTIMSLPISRLTFETLVYAPTFPHWIDAYEFLYSTNSLRRGRTHFWRIDKSTSLKPIH